MNQPLSNCCNASMNVYTGNGGTSCWICSRCGKSCGPAEDKKEAKNDENEFKQCYFEINFRSDFISQEDRDTARLALDGQKVFWDGQSVGEIKCSYKADDTSLGVSILLDGMKLPNTRHSPALPKEEELIEIITALLGHTDADEYSRPHQYKWVKRARQAIKAHEGSRKEK